jgi:hypothetical protein
MNIIELKQACFVELEQLPTENLKEVLNYLKQLRQKSSIDTKEIKLGDLAVDLFGSSAGIELDLPQHSLAQKAQKMLELHKELHESAQQTIDFIQTKYELKKVSKKLEKFWQLGANVFIDELKKQKITFSLSQEELMQWYRDKQTVLIELEKQINTLDKQIDNEVYQLYGLSDEEINIIENSH